jgi:hypothetical protein
MMAKKQGCGSQLLGGVVLIGLICWGINSCVQRNDEARRAEEQRRQSLTPEQRAEEDRIKAEQAAKAEAEQQRASRELEVQLVSEDYVRKFLKFPDDADFGFWSVPDVKSNQAGDTFYVESKVKAKNALGAQLTYRWQTIVFLDGGTWQLVSCVIDGKKVYESKELLEKIKERKGPSTLPPKTENPEQPETVNAVDLCKAYLSDQGKAGRKYRGKTVELRGIVHTAKWSPDKEEGLFVVLETGTRGFVVTAWFDKKHEKAVLGLPKGRSVHVQGKVGDVAVDKKRGEVFVSLDECMLVKGQ